MTALQQPLAGPRVAAVASRAVAPARRNSTSSHAAGSRQQRSRAASLVTRAAVSGVRAAAAWEEEHRQPRRQRWRRHPALGRAHCPLANSALALSSARPHAPQAKATESVGDIMTKGQIVTCTPETTIDDGERAPGHRLAGLRPAAAAVAAGLPPTSGVCC